MAKIARAQCHQVLECPKPFSIDNTPYKQTDFSETVKSVCSSPSSDVCGIRMCKLIIVGDINVGKTSMVNRFTRQCFSFNYKATIGVDFQIEQFEVLKMPFHVQIWDTAGQEKFKCIASAYYRRAHVVVAVFDLTSINSLHHSLEWLRDALNENVSTPLMFLVGTKLDLLKNRNDSMVAKEASKIGNSIGAEYWEVSSKTGKGIKELFLRMAALSFERIITLELEQSEPSNKIQLGHNLKGSTAKNRLFESRKYRGRRKKTISCFA